MSAVISWIKKELDYLKDSLPEIFKGFIIFILAFSGYGIALLVRFLDYNWIMIIFSGIVAQCIGMSLCFFIFRNSLKIEEETKKVPQKGKKFK